MKIKLLGIFLLISISTQAQKKIEKYYFDANGKKTDSVNASTYQHYIFIDSVQGSGIVRWFKERGKLTRETTYSNINRKNDSIKKWTKDGVSKIYHDNGDLKIQESYKNNKLHGEVTTYFENSKQLKRKDEFVAGEFVSGICYDENGNEIEHFDYFVKPSYDGGNRAIYKFIGRNMKYPKRMLALGQNGKVFVGFTVTRDAQLKNIQILRSSSPAFSKEAIRVVKLLKKWKAGIRDGEKIDVKYALPITFKLQ